MSVVRFRMIREPVRSTGQVNEQHPSAFAKGCHPIRFRCWKRPPIWSQNVTGSHDYRPQTALPVFLISTLIVICQLYSVRVRYHSLWRIAIGPVTRSPLTGTVARAILRHTDAVCGVTPAPRSQTLATGCPHSICNTADNGIIFFHKCTRYRPDWPSWGA